MKRQILTTLKKKGELTVDELSSLLGITPMGVRQHLAILEQDDLVTTSSVRRGMGRPSFLYSLTTTAEEVFPKHYDELAMGILSDIEGVEGPHKVAELFRLRVQHVVEALSPRMKGKDLEERVKELEKIFEEQGAMPEWEELDTGDIMFRVYNCGIYKVAIKFKVACDFETELVARLLQAEVERKCCLAHGDRMCAYLVKC